MCISRITKRRIIVVQSLVLSVINYCIRIWGATNATVIQRAQRLQNFAARVLLGGLRRHDLISPAFKELWLNMKPKHLLDVNMDMQKSQNNLQSEWFHFFPAIHSTTSIAVLPDNKTTFLLPKQKLKPVLEPLQ